jgi:hypothetical protein
MMSALDHCEIRDEMGKHHGRWMAAVAAFVEVRSHKAPRWQQPQHSHTMLIAAAIIDIAT